MAGEVISQDDFFCWSLTQLAREFGIARETVTRRLNDAGVPSSGVRRGHPVFRVGQAASAILLPQIRPGEALNDPDKMSPKERADWYKSEKDRLIVEREKGVSVDVNDSRQQMAVIAKTGLQVLETLPDILERDFGLQADIISGVEARIDVLREQWANLIDEVEA